MEKQFDDLILSELDKQFENDALELINNYDNDDIYEIALEIDKLLKLEGFQYEYEGNQDLFCENGKNRADY